MNQNIIATKNNKAENKLTFAIFKKKKKKKIGNLVSQTKRYLFKFVNILVQILTDFVSNLLGNVKGIYEYNIFYKKKILQILEYITKLLVKGLLHN